MTLWGRQAETFEHEDHPVIAIKGAKVSDFGGRSLSVGGVASLSVNPDVEGAYVLRGWYDAKGQGMEFQMYSSSSGPNLMGSGSKPSDMQKTLWQIQNETLGQGEKVKKRKEARLML